MSLAKTLRPLFRSALPWVTCAILLQVGLRTVWPQQIHAARFDARRAAELRSIVPDPASLRLLSDSLARDSGLLAERSRIAKQRTVSSSDPGAELASRLVPLLASRGWRLQKVKAEGKTGWAVLDLGAEADFSRILEGLRELRTVPWAVQIRRFALRPGPGGRIQADLQVASPTGSAP